MEGGGCHVVEDEGVKLATSGKVIVEYKKRISGFKLIKEKKEGCVCFCFVCIVIN